MCRPDAQNGLLGQELVVLFHERSQLLGLLVADNGGISLPGRFSERGSRSLLGLPLLALGLGRQRGGPKDQ